MKPHSYIKNSFVIARKGETVLDGTPGENRFWLDGYAIVPLERLEEELPEILKWVAEKAEGEQ